MKINNAKILKFSLFLVVIMAFSGVCGAASIAVPGGVAAASSSSLPTSASLKVNSAVQAFAAPQTGPALSIPSSIPALPNSVVTVPVQFTSNGNKISSMVFSIDYDQTWLYLDPNPGAITISLPPGFNSWCEPDTGDLNGEIDCVVFFLGNPIQTVPDGVFMNVKLRTLNPANSVLARAGFSANSLPTSFGDEFGGSVAGSTVDGSVLIQVGGPPPSTTYQVFLPLAMNYTVEPSPSPTEPSPSPTEPSPSPTEPSPTPDPGCSDLIINGGFEGGGGWEIPATAWTAGYTTAKTHSGNWSMRTGIDPPEQNVQSYSSIRQTVTIPSDAYKAELRFYKFPISSEPDASPSSPERLADPPASGLPIELIQQSTASGDNQYLLILDMDYNVWGLPKMWELSNAQTWNLQPPVDLLEFAGYSIRLQFGTYNDGVGGISAMYIDDVVLEVCR